VALVSQRPLLKITPHYERVRQELLPAEAADYGYGSGIRKSQGVLRWHHPDHCVDRGPGRYLAAIYWITDEADRRARSGAIGDRLGVEPASVTEMFVRLDVDTAYRIGYTLPEQGVERLAELVAHRDEKPCCGSGADGDCFFSARSD